MSINHNNSASIPLTTHDGIAAQRLKNDGFPANTKRGSVEQISKYDGQYATASTPTCSAPAAHIP